MKKRWFFGVVLGMLLLAVFALPLAAEETGAQEVPTTFAGQVTEFFVSHSTEVFSALALAGTGILAFCYRRGLLPVLSGGLRSLSGGVDTLLLSAKATLSASDEKIGQFTASVEPLLTQVAAVSGYLEELSRKIAELESAAAATASERETLRVLSEASVEMLKEVFTAAKLPAASKLRLGEIYSRATGDSGAGSEAGEEEAL